MGRKIRGRRSKWWHVSSIGAAHFSRDAKAKGTGHFKRRNDGNNRGSSNGSAATSSSSRGGLANANRARAQEGACRFCKKTGHWWRDCPVKPANWRPSSSDDNRRAHVATCDNNNREFIFVASGTTVGGVDAWVLDTGATQHMTACATLLNNVTMVASVKRVMFGNRDTMDVTGQGDLRLMVDSGPLTIKNVLVVPGLGANLLSVSQFTRKGMRVNIEGTMMALSTADGVHIGTARQAGGLFVLDALPRVASAQAATLTTTLSKWHNRLGHLHLAAIQAMATKGVVDGLEFVRSSGDDEKCAGCLEGKMARKHFPPSTKPNASEPLKLVHTDLCKPITPVSKGGVRYVLTLLDDATRVCWIRLLKNQDATSTVIKQWVADVEKESGFKVKRFRSDGGGEYTARELGDWLKGRGTTHEFSTPYTPQQNGPAKRLNRTLMESEQSLLSHAHAEKHWWGEVVTLATWIRNRCVTKALPNKTPLKAWSGTKPDVTDLRTFGCTCYYHVPDVTRTKLEAKARVAMYLGPSADHKAWRVWDLEHGKLVVSHDVVFYEDTFPSKSMTVPSVIIVPPPLDVADEAPTVSPPSTNEGENGSGAVGVSGDEGNAKESDPSSPPPSITPTLASTRTRRNPHPNSKYDGYSLVAGDDERGGDAMCLEAYTDTPSTYQGAMSSAEATEWERALQEEYDSLMANDVYELVPMPPGAYLVGSRWVFKKKLGPNGEVERYKARLVAQGYTQKEGVHYNETFAPVAKSATLRTLLALAEPLDLEVEQLDVKKAFLYGRLKEEVYMKQPPGFDDDSDRVCKLKRTIYGLKQSPRAWYMRIDEHLLSLGFVRSECDHALYVLNKDEKKLVLLLYIDDLLLVLDSKTLAADVKTKLDAEFSMRDRGNKTLALHQHKYLESVVDLFDMIESKLTPTPMEAGFHPLTVSDENLMDPDSANAFHSVVGSCMYVAVSTRPDLSFPVGVFGRVVSNPMVEHVRSSRRLLRYIKGTTRMGLQYEKGLLK
ncbi:unnamed protein product [Closterium sp. NIES-54]